MLRHLLIISIVSILTLTVGTVTNAAWDPPTSSPPDGNTHKPINQGDTMQVKNGTFWLGGDNYTANPGDWSFLVEKGQVGIGTTDPSSLLDLSNTVSGQTLFRASNYQGTEIMRITDSGRIGIGTTTPDSALQVMGFGNFSQPIVVGTPTNDTHATTKSYVDSTLTTEVASSTFWTLSGSDLYPADTAYDVAIGSAVPNNKFSVTGNADISGNLGIGTTNPGVKLEVDGDFKIPEDNRIYLGSSSYLRQSPTGSFDFYAGGGNGNAVYKTKNDVWFMGDNNEDGNGEIVFGFGSAIPDNKKVVIDSTGNVGIGIASPENILHLDADFVSTNSVTVDSPGISFTDSASGSGHKSGIFPTQDARDIDIIASTGGVIRLKGDTEIVDESFRIKDSGTGQWMDFTHIGSVGIIGTREDSGGTPISFNPNQVEAMRILTNGNVGIGTTGPAYALDVAGYGHFSQPVTVGTPIDDVHAATKSYVDSSLQSATTTVEDTYVNESGDTMTGDLDMNDNNVVGVGELHMGETKLLWCNGSCPTWSSSSSSFTCGDSIQDIEGNTYGTVDINGQCWMTENMHTTTYPDGTSITKGPSSDGASGWDTDQGYYSCPPNSSNDGEDCAAADSLGMLYQWSAAMAGSTAEGAQGICPDGWHVASDAEWHALEDYLDEGTCDGSRDGSWDCDPAGSKLAGNDAADENWISGDLTGHADFDSSGFNAPPSGSRYTYGSYYNRSNSVSFWSSSESGSLAWRRNLYYGLSTVSRLDNPKAYGFSVRCLKN